MKLRKILMMITLLASGLIGPVVARELYGVNVPEEKIVSGQTLKLNGAGLRTVFVLKVKAYVAAFYAPEPLRSPEAVAASAGPLRFDFNFLRAVGQERVSDAWEAQFKDSVSHTYPGYEKDKEAFVKLFGPLKKFGMESVEIEKEETRAYDDGVLKGTIHGKEFQKAFLSLWFGSKPVLPSLKADLLGQKPSTKG